MARVITSPETQATAAVERFKNDSIGGAIWLLVGCCICFLALTIYVRIVSKTPMFMASLAADIVILCSIFLLFSVPLIVIGIQSRTMGITTDTDSLSWKTRRGTFCSPWSDVLDFYETAQSANAKLYVIQTEQGDCCFSSMWTRDGLLKSLVVERAVNARTKQWDVFGARPELDWPKTFDYNDGMNRWGIPIIRIGCYLFMIWIVVEMGPRAWRMASEIAAYSGWLLGALSLILGASVYFSTSILCLFVMPSFGEQRRRRSQTITLSQDGIVYQDSKRTIEARWDEITGLTHNRPGPCIVATEHGIFDFRLTMREVKAVVHAIKTMTSETLPDGWQSKTPERLDRSNERTLTAPFGQGEQVFSYRTRTNRAFVFLGLAFFGVQGGFAIWKHPIKVHGLSLADLIVEGIIILTLVGGLGFTLWGWLTYLTESVRTDEEGIMKTTWFGSKRIGWSEVTGMKIVGGDAFTWIVISSARQNIWFSPLIVDSKKLVKEIKARVPEGCAFSTEDAERLGKLVGHD